MLAVIVGLLIWRASQGGGTDPGTAQPANAIYIPEGVTPEDLERGDTLRDLHLPHGIRVIMVRRDQKFIVPHGSLKLMPGDRLVILLGDTED